MNRTVKKRERERERRLLKCDELGSVAVLYAMLFKVTAAFLIPKAIAQSGRRIGSHRLRYRSLRATGCGRCSDDG